MERLVEIVRSHAYPLGGRPPKLLLVAPPPITSTSDSEFDAMFDGGVAELKKLAKLYAEIAEEAGCGFFDAGSVARTTPLDGVHLDAENTRAIGRGLAPPARALLGL